MAEQRPSGDRFFLQEHLVRGPVFHGGTGNKDAETVLLRAGYQPLRLGDEYRFGLAAKWRRLRAAWRLVRNLPKGATLVFQWPLYASLHRRLLVHLSEHRMDVRLICFLTDINGIKDDDEALLADELRYLRHFGSFIVHNDRMRWWLRELRPDASVSQIDFFDFLADPVRRNGAPEPQLCFAGALDKSGFLRNLQAYPALQFHLYGPGYETLPRMANCHYHGTFPAAELPSLLEGSFGLLWDGDDEQNLGGPLGNYVRYISPHKLSLYILAGLPVICHEEAAAALLVEKYGIGFAVRSLADIQDRIKNLDNEAYAAMQRNMQPLAARISTGQCLLDALSDLG